MTTSLADFTVPILSGKGCWSAMSWAEMGRRKSYDIAKLNNENLNSQKEELESEIKQLNNKISNLNKKIDKLK